jgi:hypothetical protein
MDSWWQELVKNLEEKWQELAIMSPDTENPRGNPAYLLKPINYNMPYLPIPTH